MENQFTEILNFHELESEMKPMLDHKEYSIRNLQVEEGHESFAEEFKCNICLQLLIDPVECSLCQTLYSKDCIQQWDKKNCPTCTIDTSYTKMNKHLINLFNKLSFICYLGCKAAITQDQLENHYKRECPQQYFKCPLHCSQYGSKVYMETHLQICIKSFRQCLICDEYVRRKSQKNHRCEAPLNEGCILKFLKPNHKFHSIEKSKKLFQIIVASLKTEQSLSGIGVILRSQFPNFVSIQQRFVEQQFFYNKKNYRLIEYQVEEVVHQLLFFKRKRGPLPTIMQKKCNNMYHLGNVVESQNTFQSKDQQKFKKKDQKIHGDQSPSISTLKKRSQKQTQNIEESLLSQASIKEQDSEPLIIESLGDDDSFIEKAEEEDGNEANVPLEESEYEENMFLSESESEYQDSNEYKSEKASK